MFISKVPIFKKKARLITKNNDKKNVSPGNLVRVNGVEVKTGTVWKRNILFKNNASVEMEVRKEDSCNQKA
ncbi:hypothetical protein [Methanosarcina siciliae]|nr:hypothetical protein [Methanosarcina siciliae]